MSRRDATARRTPFEIGFPEPGFAEERFAAISEEASTRGTDAADPGAFLLLAQVGRTVQDLRGEDAGAEALHTFGAFLFHAYHFDRAGRPVRLVETPLARYLVEGDPVPESWDGSPPGAAGYLQLPRHLFWTRPDPEGPAEALDGIFWTRAAGPSLGVLGVTGITPGRDGFSVLPLPPVTPEDVSAWVRRRAREEGVDFETTLPGGEIDRLYSLETAGELLKLTARALGYQAALPEALGPEEEGGEGASALPFRRLRLVGGSG